MASDHGVLKDQLVNKKYPPEAPLLPLRPSQDDGLSGAWQTLPSVLHLDLVPRHAQLPRSNFPPSGHSTQFPWEPWDSARETLTEKKEAAPHPTVIAFVCEIHFPLILYSTTLGSLQHKKGILGPS